MAYTPKSSTTPIPCNVDLYIMPLILSFTEIKSPPAVLALAGRIKGVVIVPETDRFARLRYQGTHRVLGGLVSKARAGDACPELVTLLEKVRKFVARLHDAAPPFADGPPFRLSDDPVEVAEWAKDAPKPEATTANVGVDLSVWDEIIA